jgi:hypothetical protein
LRCPDLDGTLSCLSQIFAVTADDVARALPAAAAAVAADPDAELERAILPALTDVLGRQPRAPGTIHFFHGTRAFEPDLFARRGLLPLSAVLGELWAQLRALAPEIAAERFAALREGLEDGRIEALTYKLRVDARDDGPNGVLVRDILMNARAYSSSEFIRIPEIVEDICLAARHELNVDLESRFYEASAPCIVEFAAPPRGSETALTTACWYAEAALRGQRAVGDSFFNFDGEGAAVPPADIVAVEALPPPELDADRPAT